MNSPVYKKIMKKAHKVPDTKEMSLITNISPKPKILNEQQAFFTKDILTCHSRKSTDVNTEINNG